MKKLIAVILALSLLVTLSACGGAGSTTTTTTITDAPATTTTTTPLPTLDSLPDVTVIVIDRTEGSEADESTTGVSDITTTEGGTAPTKPSATEGKPSVTVIEPSTTTIKPAIPTMPSTTTTKKTTATTTTTTKKSTTTEKTTTTTQSGGTTKTTTTTKPTTTTTTKATTTTTTKPTNPTYAYTTNQKHTALHYTQRYHYNQLDDSLKEVYALVVKAVENLDAKTEKFVVDDAHEETFRDAYLAFFQDHPEHFYLARYYGVTNYGNNKHQFSLLYSVAAYDVDPTGSNQLFDEELSAELKQRILAKKATFDKEVQKIISTIPANAPDVVKEKMAYESILKACHYNLQAVTDYLWDGRCEDNWTAYGVMVNKKGVCESYSEAFQTLCLQMSINCITVTGTTSGGGHMWNAVQLDDGWYMCDITFDDPIGAAAGTARYNYFNRTSLWMQENSNHVWQYSNDFTIPKCTKTKYAYEEYFGRGVYDEAWE